MDTKADRSETSETIPTNLRLLLLLEENAKIGVPEHRPKSISAWVCPNQPSIGFLRHWKRKGFCSARSTDDLTLWAPFT